MRRKAVSGSRGPAQTVLSLVIVLVGLGLLVAGVVAAFVSSNSSATAALIAAGAASLLAIVFRDRIQEAKLGSFELKLAVQVKDQLRSALDLKMRGNYEGSERELKHAFARFVGELDGEDYCIYLDSQTYEDRVYRNLVRIVPERFGGEVQNSSARRSFYPLIDAVLRLDGARVRRALEKQDLKLCATLVEHLGQGELRVGVTIRPGPDLEPEALVDLLHENVQNGALNATCFLLVQNCQVKESGERFRVLARKEGMHAASVVWPREATVKELDTAITDAILTICTHPLPDDSSGTDDLALAKASVGAKASRPRRARSSRPPDMGTT